MMSKEYLIFSSFLPLIGFLINLIFKKNKVNSIVSLLSIGTSFLMMMVVFTIMPNNYSENIVLFEIFISKDFVVQSGFLFDHLSVVLLLVISAVSSLISVYLLGVNFTIQKQRMFNIFFPAIVFFAYLFVLASDFIFMTLAWHGISIAIYFYGLSGLKISSLKSFYLGRVCDLGMLASAIGFTLFFETSSFSFINKVVIDSYSEEKQFYMLCIVALLLITVGLKIVVFPMFFGQKEKRDISLIFDAFFYNCVNIIMGVAVLCRLSNLYEQVGLSGALFFFGLFVSIAAILFSIFSKKVHKMLLGLGLSQMGFIFLIAGLGRHGVAVYHASISSLAMALILLSLTVINREKKDSIRLIEIPHKGKMPFFNFWGIVLGACSLSFLPGFFTFFSYGDVLWTVKNHNNFGMYAYFFVYLFSVLTALFVSRIVFVVINCRMEKKGAESFKRRFEIMALVTVASICFILTFMGVPSGFIETNSYYLQSLITGAVSTGGTINMPAVPPVFIFTNSILTILIVSLFYYVFTKRKRIKIAVWVNEKTKLVNINFLGLIKGVNLIAKSFVEGIKFVDMYLIKAQLYIDEAYCFCVQFVLARKYKIYPLKMRSQLISFMFVICGVLLYVILATGIR